MLETSMLETSKMIDMETVHSAMQKKRRWHSKVRTGCEQCKHRRIKCDEHRPACLHCERADKTCEYTALKFKIFEITTGPEFDSSLEKQSYAYFVAEGARLLSTFQHSVGPFWQKIALQIAHEYPAVRHGITAMGAIQGPLHHSNPAQIVKSRQPEMNPFSLQNMAKSMHMASLANPQAVPLEALLSACLFFTAATIWTDKVGAPGVHMGAGLRMIEEYLSGNYEGFVSSQEDIEKIFYPMFRKYVVAAFTYSDDLQTQYPSIPVNYCLDIDLDAVSPLAGIEQAYEATGTLLKCVLRLREGATMDDIFTRVAIAVDQFEDALAQLYLQGQGDPCVQSYTGHTFDHDYRHLRMHLTTIRIMLATVNCQDELNYDTHRKDFLFALVECKKLLDEETESISRGSGASNLRTTHGMIPPLFFIATKYRDLSIRRQAVELLHSALRAERGWTSCMATSLARFVIEQEHTSPDLDLDLDHDPGLSSPSSTYTLVPTRRIRLESVSFSSADKTAYLEYWDCLPSSLSVLRTAKVPYRPSPTVERDGVTADMAGKVLRGFGHTGVVLYSPVISCHCA